MNFPQHFPRLFQNLEAWLRHLRFCCLMYQGLKKTCFPLQLPEASKAQAVYTGYFSVLLLLILFPFYHGGNWGLVVKQLSPGVWVLSSRRRIPWALGQVSHLFPIQHLPGNSPGFDTCCRVSFTLPKTCSLPVSDFIWRLIINPSGLFPLCQVQTKRSWQAPMINGIYVTNSTVPQQETAIDRLGVYLRKPGPRSAVLCLLRTVVQGGGGGVDARPDLLPGNQACDCLHPNSCEGRCIFKLSPRKRYWSLLNIWVC